MKPRGQSGLHIPHAKVAIVGAGNVGSTTAYTLMLNGTVSELAIIDKNKDKAEGEALELRHCMPFTHSVDVTAGDSLSLVKDAAVVVITAGIPQKPDQPRTELLQTNVRVFKEIVPQIVAHNSQAILLVVTNPLDVLTYVTLKVSGLPACQIFGTGTVLDTARLRYLIARQFEVSPKDVIAYILGEHGDSEFVWWSTANIAGVALDQFPGYSKNVLQEIHQKTKNAVYEIIQRKGATFYAIAIVIAKIVRSILNDQARIFSVSSFIDELYGVKDVCLSVPTIIKEGGICQRLRLDLTAEEQVLFQQSAAKVKETISVAMKALEK